LGNNLWTKWSNIERNPCLSCSIRLQWLRRKRKSCHLSPVYQVDRTSKLIQIKLECINRNIINWILPKTLCKSSNLIPFAWSFTLMMKMILPSLSLHLGNKAPLPATSILIFVWLISDFSIYYYTYNYSYSLYLSIGTISPKLKSPFQCFYNHV